MNFKLLSKRFFLALMVFSVLNFVNLPASFAQEKTPILLEPLPFAQDALEPYISSHTIGFHYGKHHTAYVAKANELLKGNPLAAKPIEEIIKETANKADQVAIFSMVAQAWNHAFFWKCLKPNGGGKPAGKLAEMIDEKFGSYEAFLKEFLNAGKSVFGSGWVWLVVNDGTLAIVKTQDAGNPMSSKQKPLLVLDVWEHSYYLDYQNRRPDYLEDIMKNLVNWEFVSSNL